ncbi:hypothetical protein P879_08634 [Paragonimus westermani]|uniref:Uncharacterized protein n=1 Tax=Paragonimus westermani TaxID=34504 RepID=A0A8T0DB82_9TREM|nr:hypothetical protein P879_08634 [Paragonimus westermani]
MQLEAELARARSANSRLELGLQELVQQSAANTQAYALEKTVLQEAKDRALSAAQFEHEKLQSSLNAASQEAQAIATELNHTKRKILDQQNNLKYWREQAELNTNLLHEKDGKIIQLKQELENCYRDCEHQTHSLSVLKVEQKTAITLYEEKLSQLQAGYECKHQEATIMARNVSQLQEQLGRERKTCETLRKELATLRGMLVKAREEIIKRSSNEERLEEMVTQLQLKLDQTLSHKTAAETASKSALHEVKQLEHSLETYEAQKMSVQNRLQELEQQRDEALLVKCQFEKRFTMVSNEYRAMQSQHAEKQKHLERSEVCIQTLNNKIKLMQTTLEEESMKVQRFTERLQHVEQNREELVQNLTEMSRSREQLKTEFENYRILNQTPESVVSRRLNE